MLRVAVVGGATLGRDGVESLESAVGAASVSLVDGLRGWDPRNADVTVVDLAPDRKPDGYDLSAAARSAPAAAVFVVLDDADIYVVPQGQAPGSPCYWCFELRRLGLQKDPLTVLAMPGGSKATPAKPKPAALGALVKHLAELVTSADWRQRGMWTAVIAIAADTGASRKEPLAAHARCPLGGVPAAAGVRPPPTAVVSDVCGLVGAPRVTECATFYVAAAALSNPNLAIGRARRHAYGCSHEKALAEWAAVGEALELYSCAVWQPASEDVETVPRRDAVEPSRFFGLRRAGELRAAAWTRMTSLDDGSERTVPVEVVSPRLRRGAWQQPTSTNGMAAHIDPDRAVGRAVAEIVERDAFLLTWMARLDVERLRLETHPRDAVRRLVREMRSLGVEVTAYALPVSAAGSAVLAVALATGDGVRGARVAMGLGCDAAEAVAVGKAASEALLAWRELTSRIQRLSPDSRRELMSLDSARFPGRDALHYAVSGDRRPLEFILSTGAERDVAAGAITAPPGAGWWVSALANEGFDVLYADVTPPEVAAAGWHVARAAVPDLLPMIHGSTDLLGRSPRLRDVAGSGRSGVRTNPDPHPFI